jgi:hypothetical protein
LPVTAQQQPRGMATPHAWLCTTPLSSSWLFMQDRVKRSAGTDIGIIVDGRIANMYMIIEPAP